jgi:hypothetical protein
MPMGGGGQWCTACGSRGGRGRTGINADGEGSPAGKAVLHLGLVLGGGDVGPVGDLGTHGGGLEGTLTVL